MEQTPGPHDGQRIEEAEGAEVSLVGLIEVLGRWRRLVLAMTFGIPLIVAVIMLLTPNKYTATGAILVETPEGSGVGSALLGQLGALAGLPSNISSTDIYAAILQSRRVRESVVTELGLVKHYDAEGDNEGERLEDALKTLHDRMRFDTSDFVTIYVSAKDEDPDMAARIANAHLRQLEEANQTLAISRARRTRQLVQDALAGTEAELDSSLHRMQRFQERNGVFSIDKQIEGTLELIGSLQAELLGSETEIEALTGFSSPNSSRVRNLDLRIKALKAQIRELIGKLEEVAPEGVHDSARVPARGSTESFYLPLRQLPHLAREYARLAMDTEVQKAKYNLLATQLEQTKIDESQSIPAYEILDWAERPWRKSEPRRTLFVLAGLMGGLLGSVLIAVILDDLNRRLDDRARATLAGFVPGFWKRGAGSTPS